MIRLITMLLALVVASHHAVAQSDQEPRKSKLSVYVDVGFSNLYRVDHWAPLTVWLESEEPISGRLVLEHSQDATQTARIVAPYTTTPGIPVPVNLTFAVPSSFRNMTLTVLNDRGRRLEVLKLSTTPDSDEILIRAPLQSTTGLVVSVGRTSLGRSLKAVQSAISATTRHDDDGAVHAADSPWIDLEHVGIEPERLPMTRVAYDGLTALVAETSVLGEVDGRSLDAIKAWIESGGQLVLLAHGPGSDWRQWLPSRISSELSLDGVATLSAPSNLDAIIEQAEYLEDFRDSGAAATLPARAIRIGETLEQDAWRTRWPTGEGSGLIAEGPVGFGWITVVGVDPERVPAVMTTATAGAVWQDILRPALGSWLIERERAENQSNANAWSWQSMTTMTSVLDELADVPRVGGGAFFVIGIAVVVLGLLLGPGDYVLLGRFRQRHRSWLSALLWIALASAVAYVAPRVLREGDTRVNRLVVVDRIVGEDVLGPAWQTGVTGIFANHSGRVRFEEPNPASWWHGVSAIYSGSSSRVGSSLLTVQPPAAAGAPLLEYVQNMWTFRTFVDDGPVSTALGGRAELMGDEVSVQVVGVPRDAEVTSFVCRIGDLWFEPEFEAGETGLTARFRAGDDLEAIPEDWQGYFTERDGEQFWNPPRFRPGHAFELHAPHRRSHAIETRLRSRRWIALYVEYRGSSSDIRIDWEADYSQTCVARLLVPLDGVGRLLGGDNE